MYFFLHQQILGHDSCLASKVQTTKKKLKVKCSKTETLEYIVHRHIVLGWKGLQTLETDERS